MVFWALKKNNTVLRDYSNLQGRNLCDKDVVRLNRQVRSPYPGGEKSRWGSVQVTGLATGIFTLKVQAEYSSLHKSRIRNGARCSQFQHSQLWNRNNYDINIICWIWGFHGGEYEKYCIFGCDTVCVWYKLTFRRNVSRTSVRRLLN
jgi:hypothetical protein